jgi:hypothetical protein
MTVPLSALTDTWNSSGQTFTAIQMNVTNTSSAVGSKLLDLQVGGSSASNIDSAGNLTCTTIVTPSLTPAALGATSSFNDYFPGGRNYFIKLSVSGVGTSILTGLNTSSQVDGEQHYIVNSTATNSAITISHQDASSVATNRFNVDANSSIKIALFESLWCIYDGTAGRWRVSKNN